MWHWQSRSKNACTHKQIIMQLVSRTQTEATKRWNKSSAQDKRHRTMTPHATKQDTQQLVNLQNKGDHASHAGTACEYTGQHHSTTCNTSKVDPREPQNSNFATQRPGPWESFSSRIYIFQPQTQKAKMRLNRSIPWWHRYLGNIPQFSPSRFTVALLTVHMVVRNGSDRVHPRSPIECEWI